MAEFIRLHKNSIKSIEISVVDGPRSNHPNPRILKPLIEAIEETKDLRALVLNLNTSNFNFNHTDGFDALKSLGHALRCLPKLECLAVGVESNSFSRKSFDNLSYTPKLKSVVFDFRGHWGIGSDDLSKNMRDLQKLRRLEELTLYLGDNLKC
ncbi:hypothetical protein [Pandoraea sputorum]|uniref:hypothetical protein n=1 Tax=Pandoraea sputorum TaxID=93222 RepID=UPI0012425A94|nr:hypothetical protein [Pandoraea sputorum]